MKHIILFSGGKGSFFATVKLLRNINKRDLILLFTDTKIEDEDLYRFLDDCETYFKIKITRISDGRTPWGVFFDEKFLGNSRIDPCSKILKRKLADKWISDRYSHKECVCYVGIDWTEEHRFLRMAPRKLPYIYKAPLCEPPFFEKKELSDLLNKAPKMPRLYSMGFAHNNCGGFCVKAGKGHFKNLLEKMPERFYFHEKQEQKFQKMIGKQHTILKEMSLTDLRKSVKQRRFTFDDEIDVGGCGCMIDEPENKE